MNECLLVPELCVMAGFTDEITADFNIMKDMANSTKKSLKCNSRQSSPLPLNNKSTNLESRHINRAGKKSRPCYSSKQHNAWQQLQFKINKQRGSFDCDIKIMMFAQSNLDHSGALFCENDRKLVKTSFMTTLN